MSDRDYLRKLVGIVDANSSPASPRNITESKQSRSGTNRSRTLAESKKLTQLIENSDLTEEQLTELLAGLGALARKAGGAVGGAASKASQAARDAASAGAQKVSGAASAARDAASAGAQKVSGAARDAASAGAQKLSGAASAARDAASAGAQKVSGAASAARDAASAGAQRATGAVKSAAGAVKDVYQSGEQQAAYKSALQTVSGIESTIASTPALAPLAKRGDKITLGQIKAALQKLTAAE
jgi:hypothetical protein